jgi:hypothetical protein
MIKKEKEKGINTSLCADREKMIYFGLLRKWIRQTKQNKQQVGNRQLGKSTRKIQISNFKAIFKYTTASQVIF